MYTRLQALEPRAAAPMRASGAPPRYRTGRLQTPLFRALAVVELLLVASAAPSVSANALFSEGCASCPGACFAGECLLPDADLEAGGQPARRPPEPSALGWSSSAQGRVSLSRPAEQIVEPLIEPLADPQATPAAPAPADIALNERYLQGQLQYARSVEAAQESENSALRQELDGWRRASSPDSEQPAAAADAAKDRDKDKQLEAEVADAAKRQPRDGINLGQLASTAKRYVFNTGKVPLDDRTNLCRLFALFCAATTLAFLGWRERDPLQEKVLQATAPLPFVHRQLRRAGVGRYVVEVSELQVTNLAARGGDVYVSLLAGGKEQRTGAHEVDGHGGVLRFHEAFRVHLRRGDPEGKCVFSIIDRDDPLAEKRLARLEVPDGDVLGLACRPHGEYCSFDLFPEAAPPRHWGGGQGGPAAAGRPSLGLRLRDVSLPAGEAPRGARRKAAPQPPEPGYATFAPPRGLSRSSWGFPCSPGA